MNGFAGLLLQKHRRLARAESEGLVKIWLKASAALAVGQDALIGAQRRENGFDLPSATL